MSYDSHWKVLADFLIELQKRGEKIPAEVMNDLRSAKTIIHVLKVDPTQTESISRVDTYLRRVESYVISRAEKLGIVENWLKKIKEIKILKDQERKVAVTRFIPGAPRDKNWIRIQISEDNIRENVKILLKESKLSYKIMKNGHILIYGKKENIRKFVKTIAKLFHDSKN